MRLSILWKNTDLSEDGGEKTFDKFLKKLKTSKAFSLLDNMRGGYSREPGGNF